MKKAYEYLGYIVERGATGWRVLDRRYEATTWCHTARSEHAARAWIRRQHGARD
jgi:hypothetical protein